MPTADAIRKKIVDRAMNSTLFDKIAADVTADTYRGEVLEYTFADWPSLGVAGHQIAAKLREKGWDARISEGRQEAPYLMVSLPEPGHPHYSQR